MSLHSPAGTFSIAAAIATDDQGRLLLVRKRGTRFFMQPGGKVEPGETPEHALVRELEEELGVRCEPDALEPLGLFAAEAANEPGWHLQAALFRVALELPVSAAAEIDEVVWVMPEEALALPLAPLTRDTVLPLLQRAL